MCGAGVRNTQFKHKSYRVERHDKKFIHNYSGYIKLWSIQKTLEQHYVNLMLLKTKLFTFLNLDLMSLYFKCFFSKFLIKCFIVPCKFLMILILVPPSAIQHPLQWGILGGHGGWLDVVPILLLKCICLVFHVENGQNEYILIISSFTNIDL